MHNLSFQFSKDFYDFSAIMKRIDSAIQTEIYIKNLIVYIIWLFEYK